MKLYTEEQVLKIISITKTWSNLSDDYLIATVTPIELPSDEEIENLDWGSSVHDYHIEGFKAGSKWMKEQIPNQNK